MSTMEMYLARDREGFLALYVSEPAKDEDVFFPDVYDNEWKEQYIVLDKELFPEVTFENSPVKVEIKIKK